MMLSRRSVRQTLSAPVAGGAAAARMVPFAIVIALCAPVSGLAQDVAAPPGSEPVIIYHTPLDQRRAELRQALISEDDAYQAKRERRKLSPEERSALNAEWRAAIRGVYERQQVSPAR